MSSDLTKDSDGREAMVKAHIVGRADEESLFAEESSIDRGLSAELKQEVVEPPFPPSSYNTITQQSQALRAPISAYAANIDGFGHTFEPVLDPDSKEGRELIETSILLEREQGAEDKAIARLASVPGKLFEFIRDRKANRPSVSQKVTRKEIDRRAESLKREIRIQRFTAERFFSHAPVDQTFVRLRMESRQDLETGGNFFWEIARNRLGEISRIQRLQSQEMRLVHWDAGDDIEIDQPHPMSPISDELRPIQKRFRRYVRLRKGTSDMVQPTYFKSLGDPRVISKHTGKAYKTEAAMKADEGEPVGVRPATEILHYRIYDPQTDYGVSRWMGNLLEVLGNRSACEVNYFYFKNKSVPPLAVFVSGGTLSKDAKSRLESYIENNIKGERNFHRMLILEAIPARSASGNESSVKIELQPLTSAQLQDAQFLEYIAANVRSIDRAFRISPALYGDARDLPPAMLAMLKQLAEEQVFEPERQLFDDWVNRTLMPELGVNLLKYRSLAPITRDNEAMSKVIATLTRAGIMVPNEAREVASDVLNRKLPKTTEKWGETPVGVHMAELKAGPLAVPGVGGGDGTRQEDLPKPERESRRDGLEGDLTDGMGVQDNGNAQQEMGKSLSYESPEDGEITLIISPEEMNDLVIRDKVSELQTLLSD